MFNNKCFTYNKNEGLYKQLYYITSTSPTPIEIKFLDGTTRIVSDKISYETELTPEEVSFLTGCDYRTRVTKKADAKSEEPIFKNNPYMNPTQTIREIRKSLSEELERIKAQKDREFGWTPTKGDVELFDYNTTTAKDVVDKLFKDKESTGVKENKGKLFHELDFEFVKQMSERMAASKVSGKYPKFNWKKDIDEVELRMAIFRHVLEVMEGRYEDEGRPMGHLEALATNAMMLAYQVRNKK